MRRYVRNGSLADTRRFRVKRPVRNKKQTHERLIVLVSLAIWRLVYEATASCIARAFQRA
jgi:hypothetical protein